MAVGLPLKTTYANGDVYSASDVNDTNGTVNVIGQTTNLYAGKNKIINGDFGIWQRGTSFTPASASFTADRWSNIFDGTGATRTISRQTFTPATAPVAGYEFPYFFRFAQSVAGITATYNIFQNRMEDVRTFAGQTVTISFWGKAASTTSIVKLNLEQDFGTGGSPSAGVSTDIAATNFSLTTSWQRFTVTTTVPSISGKTIGTTTPGFLGLRVWVPINSTFTLDFFGFQMESGSSATAIQPAAGTWQGELALCQRYDQRWVLDNAAPFVTGMAISTTEAISPLPLTVTLRVAPSSIDFSNLQGADYVANKNFTAASLSGEQTASAIRIYYSGASSLTTYRPYIIRGNGSAAYLGVSAEL